MRVNQFARTYVLPAVAFASLTSASSTAPAHAQNIEGQIVASQYGTWRVPGYAPDTYTGFAPTACRVQGGASFFAAFSLGTPVEIVDGNPSQTETVTPTNVVINNNACAITIAPAHQHNLPFYLTSATGGLQEAIDANLTNPGVNTIILNNPWYLLGGSAATIAAVKGSATLGLVDVTTTPFTWYAWSGGAYIKIAVGGGVPSVNSITSATTIAAGANVTVSTAGSTITVAAAGASGTGTVGSFSQYQNAFGPNSGSMTTVGALANKYTLPTGLSSAQLIAWFAGLSTGQTTIQNGDAHLTFSNPNFVGIDDEREDVPVADWNVKWSGAQCDLRGAYGTVTAGSPTLTVSGYNFVSADAGDQATHAGAKSIEMVYQVSGIPTRFDATIIGVTNGTTATLSTKAPFTIANYSIDIGHRDDAAIASAFGHWSYARPISFPTGNCWSDTIMVYGQSFHGNGQQSQITGLAGDDVFASLDPTYGDFQSAGSNNQIHDMTWNFDPRINAAQPWQDVGPTGTVTAHPASYRPVGLLTVWANDPLGPGWMIGPGPNGTGAINGVATTNGTTSITITSAAIPVVGEQILFPYASTGVFSTTVGAAAGSTVTLNAAYPPTGTLTQQEWFAGANPSSLASGTAVQAIQTAIPAGTRAPVAITAYSITSNIITLTSANSYTPGQILHISGFGTSAFLNGAALTVLSAGLSGTEFKANFTHANASATERGSASIFPFLLTLKNPITPPLTPNSAGTGSNVAPYGLVQIDSEQCSYFGDSSYPATVAPTPSITLTACAQNGTAAAAHSAGAAIAPLNPFQPSWPWPVTPSSNAGVTPANAVYFPAWDIGNAAWSQPIYNGQNWNPGAALYFSNMHDIWMQIGTFYPGSGGNPAESANGYQMQNATAGMYIVPTPYKARFENLHIIDPQFGIFEGTPSINAYGMFGGSYPTADGSTWQNILIQSAGFDTLFVGGQSDTKRDFLTFCQNGGETGNSWPGLPPAYLGCGAAWIDGGTYDDKNGGGGSNNSHRTMENWYVEAEQPTGGQQEMQPYFEFNCAYCTYRINPFTGGVTFIEGVNNNFTGMQSDNAGYLPIINYGANTTMTDVVGASYGGNSNTYGLGTFINYGPNASISGQTDNTSGPFGSLAAGNTIAPITGQTAEAFATGNDSSAYVSSSSAIIYPDQFNASSNLEPFPMSAGWTFDDTAPISHSYAACNTTPSAGCSTHAFNGAGGIPVGPGQKLVPGKYVAHYALRTVNGANTLNLRFAAGATVYNENVATSSTWTQYTTAPIDFSGSTGSTLNVWFNNTSTSDQVRIAYLIFTPVWGSVPLQQQTPADNAACTPGSILGSDANYLYVCTASGTVKRAVLNSY